MSQIQLDPSACPVAAVCDNQVRIYGATERDKYGKEIRPLMRTINFRHYGAALAYAKEHDDRSRVAPSNWRAK